jgi:hypothetical protein
VTVIRVYCDTSSHRERRLRILEWSVHRQWTAGSGADAPAPPCDVGSWGPSLREDSRPAVLVLGLRSGPWGSRRVVVSHHFVSGLIASGCDVVTVQRAMGHRKVRTTFDTYSHLWPTAEDTIRAGTAAMMAEVFENSADQRGVVTL